MISDRAEREEQSIGALGRTYGIPPPLIDANSHVYTTQPYPRPSTAPPPPQGYSSVRAVPVNGTHYIVPCLPPCPPLPSAVRTSVV